MATTTTARPQRTVPQLAVPPVSPTNTSGTTGSTTVTTTKGTGQRGRPRKTAPTTVTSTTTPAAPIVSTSATKVKTEPVTPVTKTRAKWRAIIQLLETIPEDLLSDYDTDADDGDDQIISKNLQNESEFEIDTDAEEA